MNDLVARKQALPLGFDYNAYAKYNPDVLYSWDHDLATHWILYGQREGRQYKEDNPYTINTDIPPVPIEGVQPAVEEIPQESPPTESGGNNTGVIVLGIVGLALLARKRMRRSR